MSNLKILAIDGLDGRQVRRLKLKSLMLNHNGDLEVPINKQAGEPISPEVWRAFLTGEVKPTMFTNVSRWRWWLIALRKYIPFSLGLGNRLQSSIKALADYPKRDFNTLVEEYGLTQVNFPYYSFEFTGLTSVTQQWLDGTLSEGDFKYWAFTKAKQAALQTAKAEGNVIGYIGALDLMQHCFYSDPEYLDFWYRLCAAFAEAVQPDIILSDHGADGSGKHSKLGYWAAKPDIKPQRITDFYGIIGTLLGRPDKEEIKRKLGDLGYI